jgi:hypothetical protein
LNNKGYNHSFLFIGKRSTIIMDLGDSVTVSA